jgi:hypothetical protein
VNGVRRIVLSVSPASQRERFRSDVRSPKLESGIDISRPRFGADRSRAVRAVRSSARRERLSGGMGFRLGAGGELLAGR